MNNIKNALITEAKIHTSERCLLTVDLTLNFDNNFYQIFGGFSLYLSKVFTHFTHKGDFAGHYIYRLLEIAGVQKWSDIIGKAIRFDTDEHGVIIGIGHIIKEDWFYPAKDIGKMLAGEKP